ncbi:ATP-binding protein [Peijinzhouia sedimentorum]
MRDQKIILSLILSLYFLYGSMHKLFLKNKSAFRNALWVLLLYLPLGFAWIYFTDKIGPKSEELYKYYQTYKGFAYVIVSGLLLFVLVYILSKNLLKSRETYKVLFDNIPNPVWVYDKQTFKILEVNDKACETYQYSRAEFLTKTILDIRPKEEIEKIRLAIAQATENKKDVGIWKHQRKDGRLVYVQGISIQIDFNGEPAALAIARDVTAEYLAQEEKMRILDQLVTQNQNLEQFAFMVSHNLRTPVAQIEGLVQLFDNSNIQNPINNQVINHLKTSAHRLDEIILDLSQTIRIKDSVNVPWEEIDLDDILAKIKLTLNEIIQNSNANITFESNGSDNIRGIKGYIYSIMLNLISNSLKYRQVDIAPAVRVSLDQETDKYFIKIIDNGLGFDVEKWREDIFGLYKRFHFHVEGKGIGLFLVRTQVEALGGKIEVDSQENNGSTFTIILPKERPVVNQY